MKHAFVSLLMLLLAGSALAVQPTFTFNVPFAFTAGHQVFPAGSYTVEQKTPDLLLLRSKSAAAFLEVIPEGSLNVGDAGKLEFRQAGGSYVLSQISGNGERWDLPMPHRKMVLTKNSAPVQIGVSGK